MRFSDRDQFLLAFGQSDIKTRFAFLLAVEQKLQTHRRFTRAGISLKQIKPIFGQTAFENEIQSFNSDRNTVGVYCVYFIHDL